MSFWGPPAQRAQSAGRSKSRAWARPAARAPRRDRSSADRSPDARSPIATSRVRDARDPETRVRTTRRRCGPPPRTRTSCRDPKRTPPTAMRRRAKTRFEPAEISRERRRPILRCARGMSGRATARRGSGHFGCVGRRRGVWHVCADLHALSARTFGRAGGSVRCRGVLPGSRRRARQLARLRASHRRRVSPRWCLHRSAGRPRGRRGARGFARSGGDRAAERSRARQLGAACCVGAREMPSGVLRFTTADDVASLSHPALHHRSQQDLSGVGEV
jgi:hypothetical protein